MEAIGHFAFHAQDADQLTAHEQRHARLAFGIGQPRHRNPPRAPQAGRRLGRLPCRRVPDASAMLARMRSRRPSSQMPPLGTVLRDDKAIDAVTKWIAEDLARRAPSR